jgi:hypothetical protein
MPSIDRGARFLVFLMNLLINFHSGCTNLHFHQQGIRPLFPYIPVTLIVVCFLNVVHSDKDEVESKCTFDLRFPLAKDVEGFFVCLLIIYTSFENCPFSSFAPHSNWISCYFGM